ncbi:PKD domain-containing protein, partial [Penaeicola halotolerans]
MEYSWKLLEKPTGANPTLSVLNSIAVQFTTDTEGAYTFELTVSYNAWTDKAEVTIVVSEGDENFLEARGGDDQSQNLGTMIQ